MLYNPLLEFLKCINVRMKTHIFQFSNTLYVLYNLSVHML